MIKYDETELMFVYIVTFNFKTISFEFYLQVNYDKIFYKNGYF